MTRTMIQAIYHVVQNVEVDGHVKRWTVAQTVTNHRAVEMCNRYNEAAPHTNVWFTIEAREPAPHDDGEEF